jgi:leucyl-tRNA synthetase
VAVWKNGPAKRAWADRFRHPTGFAIITFAGSRARAVSQAVSRSLQLGAYDFDRIQSHWQRLWEREGTWQLQDETAGQQAASESVYLVLQPPAKRSASAELTRFRDYSFGDAIAHYRRCQGACALHAMGYGAVGSGDEESPASLVGRLRSWGMSMDAPRERASHGPQAHARTQSVFLRLLERGLAYHEHDQWFLGTTGYAERLLADLDQLDWSEHQKRKQRNLIGRSEGAEVTFCCEELDIDLPVFTTRVEALLGATFFVLAAGHPDVARLVEGTEYESGLSRYLAALDESAGHPDGAASPSGVPLGRSVVNPLNGERLPVFVSSYVMSEYGTGAVVGVPGHDHGDLAFAVAFALPVRTVIDDGASTGGGVLTDTGSRWDGLRTDEARPRILADLEQRGLAVSSVYYRLRDWRISGRSATGTLVPVVSCERCGILPVAVESLPMLHDALDSPDTTCPGCSGPASHTADTFDTSFVESLYPLHYRGSQRFGGVDCYVSAPEAGSALLHERFVTKALADIGLVDTQEPYARLASLGSIKADDPRATRSRDDTIDLQVYLARYGVDTMRCFMLFLGPPHRDLAWSDERLDGLHRFLARLWALGDELPRSTPRASETSTPADLRLRRRTHQTIVDVTERMDTDLQLHKAIASIMGLVTESIRVRSDVAYETLRSSITAAASLLFPFAPHISAEVYYRLTGERVWEQPWPLADPAYLLCENIEILVEVDGKLCARVQARYDATPEQLKEVARRSAQVREHIASREIKREVVVPGRLVNFVTA